MRQRSSAGSGSAEDRSAVRRIFPSLSRFDQDGEGAEPVLKSDEDLRLCGRLMCCLKYEEDTYEELNGRLPNIGDYVTTDDGLKGEVHSVSILRQLVKVIVTVNNDEKEIREYKVDQLKFRPKKRREKQSSNDAELKQLEALEKKEGKSKLDGD